MTVKKLRARATTPRLFLLFTGFIFTTAFPAGAVHAQEGATAIVGATVIDGNGGPPLSDATIVIRGQRIAEIGPRASVAVPAGARVIDGAGKYVTPGIVDTNVHMGPITGGPVGEYTFARYWDRLEGLSLQGVQGQLKYGVTTVRDSYGPPLALMAVRDSIAAGTWVGPRMYVAGNILGWEGPSTRRAPPRSELTFFQEQLDDLFTLGTAEEFLNMTPEEMRVAMNTYLDRGPDFIKYNGTSHTSPALISFSPRVQRVIVEETHKRGLVAETHSTSLEGLRLSLLAGIDVVQHPENVGLRVITDELVDLIVERGVICSLLPNKYTGRIWQQRLEQREIAREAQAEAQGAPQRRIPKTSFEIRREVEATGLSHPGTVYWSNLEARWANGQKLIRGGCIVSVGADNLLFGRPGVAPEFLREDHPVPEHLEPGIGTIVAIEGLVELGMTPSEAIVAATKHGAMACKALDDFGTLEVGKFADILVLGADPLADISNIRQLEVVMKEGEIIDIDNLPTNPLTGEW
jgi:imidazolonepropionase-like amidohydrolase